MIIKIPFIALLISLLTGCSSSHDLCLWGTTSFSETDYSKKVLVHPTTGELTAQESQSILKEKEKTIDSIMQENYMIADKICKNSTIQEYYFTQNNIFKNAAIAPSKEINEINQTSLKLAHIYTQSCKNLGPTTSMSCYYVIEEMNKALQNNDLINLTRRNLQMIDIYSEKDMKNYCSSPKAYKKSSNIQSTRSYIDIFLSDQSIYTVKYPYKTKDSVCKSFFSTS